MHAIRTAQATAVLALAYAGALAIGIVAMTVVGVAWLATTPFRTRTA
jgi:hypothetical protein